MYPKRFAVLAILCTLAFARPERGSPEGRAAST